MKIETGQGLDVKLKFEKFCERSVCQMEKKRKQKMKSQDDIFIEVYGLLAEVYDELDGGTSDRDTKLYLQQRCRAKMKEIERRFESDND